MLPDGFARLAVFPENGTRVRLKHPKLKDCRFILAPGFEKMTRSTENSLVIATPSRGVPAIIERSGGNARFACDEFFKATINNEHTRRAGFLNALPKSWPTSRLRSSPNSLGMARVGLTIAFTARRREISAAPYRGYVLLDCAAQSGRPDHRFSP